MSVETIVNVYLFITFLLRLSAINLEVIDLKMF